MIYRHTCVSTDKDLFPGEQRKIYKMRKPGEIPKTKYTEDTFTPLLEGIQDEQKQQKPLEEATQLSERQEANKVILEIREKISQVDKEVSISPIDTFLNKTGIGAGLLGGVAGMSAGVGIIGGVLGGAGGGLGAGLVLGGARSHFHNKKVKENIEDIADSFSHSVEQNIKNTDIFSKTLNTLREKFGGTLRKFNIHVLNNDTAFSPEIVDTKLFYLEQIQEEIKTEIEQKNKRLQNRLQTKKKGIFSRKTPGDDSKRIAVIQKQKNSLLQKQKVTKALIENLRNKQKENQERYKEYNIYEQYMQEISDATLLSPEIVYKHCGSDDGRKILQNAIGALAHINNDEKAILIENLKILSGTRGQEMLSYKTNQERLQYIQEAHERNKEYEEKKKDILKKIPQGLQKNSWITVKFSSVLGEKGNNVQRGGSRFEKQLGVCDIKYSPDGYIKLVDKEKNEYLMRFSEGLLYAAKGENTLPVASLMNLTKIDPIEASADTKKDDVDKYIPENTSESGTNKDVDIESLPNNIQKKLKEIEGILPTNSSSITQENWSKFTDIVKKDTLSEESDSNNLPSLFYSYTAKKEYHSMNILILKKEESDIYYLLPLPKEREIKKDIVYLKNSKSIQEKLTPALFGLTITTEEGDEESGDSDNNE